MRNLFSILLVAFVLQFNSNVVFAQDGKDRLSVFDDRETPDDPNVLFYIHKDINPNCIVYALKKGADGKIDPKNPMEVFWRRYQEDGRKKKLGWLEKTFAFDFDVKKVKDKPNTYMFDIVAVKKRYFYFTQDKKGNPITITKINGKNAKIEKIYLTVDDSKTMHKLLSLEIFGKDPKTGKLVYEKIVND